MRTLLLILYILLALPTPALRAEAASRLDSLRAATLRHVEAEAWDSAVAVGERWLEAAYKAEDYHGEVIDAHVALGKAYAHLGYYPQAMGNLGQAHANATSAQNAEMVGQAFQEVWNIAQEEQQRIVEHRKNQQLLWLGIVALAVVCLLLLAMYRQKSRLLLAIVRQNHEALRQTQAVKWKSSLTDEKKRELLVRLDQLMQERRTYCENLLTKDRVAELLGTNRTYLSQAVREAYGKSFTQYINDLRINAAILLLDDPANQRPLRLVCMDLGFNSPTTFNAQFQARTGMTPAQYRIKARQLNG